MMRVIAFLLALAGVATAQTIYNSSGAGFSPPAITCTNQFIRSIAAATGVGTCATVSLTADVTNILPVANGGLAASSIPNFRVTLASNQSVTNATMTKVTFDTVTFDVGSYWDSTNKQYKPLVAGTYMICSNITVSGTFTLGANNANTIVSKNGLAGSGGTRATSTGTDMGTGAVGGTLDSCALVPLNGSTDTVELDVFLTATSPIVSGDANFSTYFTGYRISP